MYLLMYSMGTVVYIDKRRQRDMNELLYERKKKCGVHLCLTTSF